VTVELSVVIPTLNAEATIGAVLEGLARQTRTDGWEVVVVDNGSNDGTLAVVESFQERLPGLQIVDGSARRSIGFARNLGVENAGGELIAFCDADDEVDEGWVAAMADGLREHRLVASRHDHDRLNAGWTRESRDPPAGDGVQTNWFPPYLPHTGGGGMGVHRALHREIGGFDESLAACEDNDYCFRAQLHASATLVGLPDAVYYYRLRDTMGGIFRQALLWADANALIQRRYRERGTRVDAAWKWPLRYWKPIVRGLPGVIRKGGRARFLWMLGWQLGRLRGSVRYRVLAI
jgi:glycosyltransferase involved in cell wall biosynthesis